MTAPVITATPDTSVSDLADLLLRHHISAVPIVGEDGRAVGIVSEGDLIRRIDDEGDGRHAWWLSLLGDGGDRVRDYVRSHGMTARRVMTTRLISVDENASLAEIAATLEQNRIKRVLVIHAGDLVGVVSRANLLHGLATYDPRGPVKADDRALREKLRFEIDRSGIRPQLINTVVADGHCHVFGSVTTADELEALRVVCENVPGLKSVEFKVGLLKLPGFGI